MLYHDLTPQQRTVLLYVSEYPGATLADVRAACKCSNSPARTLLRRGFLTCDMANGRMKAGSLRVGNPGVIVLRYDADGRLTYASDTLYRVWGQWMMIGKTREELWEAFYRHARLGNPDGPHVQPEHMASVAIEDRRKGLDDVAYLAHWRFVPIDDGLRLIDEAGEFAGTEVHMYVYSEV